MNEADLVLIMAKAGYAENKRQDANPQFIPEWDGTSPIIHTRYINNYTAALRALRAAERAAILP